MEVKSFFMQPFNCKRIFTNLINETQKYFKRERERRDRIRKVRERGEREERESDIDREMIERERGERGETERIREHIPHHSSFLPFFQFD